MAALIMAARRQRSKVKSSNAVLAQGAHLASSTVDENRIVFVHGIGEDRSGNSSESWARKSVYRISDGLLRHQPLIGHDDLAFEIENCPQSCTELVKHQHVIARDAGRVVSRWRLVAVVWAHNLELPRLREFIQWLAVVLNAIVFWHGMIVVNNLVQDLGHADRRLQSKARGRSLAVLPLFLIMALKVFFAILWRAAAVAIAYPCLAVIAIIGVIPEMRRLILRIPILDTYIWINNSSVRRQIVEQVAYEIAGRNSVAHTVVVAHSQGAAVAVSAIRQLARSARRRLGVLDLLTVGSGAGIIEAVMMVSRDARLRRGLFFIGVLCTGIAAFSLPAFVSELINLTRFGSLLLLFAGPFGLLPIDPHIALLLLVEAASAYDAVFWDLLNRSLVPPYLAVAFAFNIAIFGLVQSVNLRARFVDWQACLAVPSGVRHSVDIRATHDLVSGRRIPFDAGSTTQYSVAQTGGLADHVRYFSNRASFVPILLSMMLSATLPAESRALLERAGSARHLQRVRIRSILRVRASALMASATLWATGVIGFAVFLLGIASVLGLAKLMIWAVNRRIADLLAKRPEVLLTASSLTRERMGSKGSRLLLILSLAHLCVALAAGRLGSFGRLSNFGVSLTVASLCLSVLGVLSWYVYVHGKRFAVVWVVVSVGAYIISAAFLQTWGAFLIVAMFLSIWLLLATSAQLIRRVAA